VSQLGPRSAPSWEAGRLFVVLLSFVMFLVSDDNCDGNICIRA
jgi:hypothetical protein